MKQKSFGIPNRVLFFIILIFGIVSKLFLSETTDLSNDEIFSIYHAQMDIVDLFKELSTGNNPPLFETILHFWIKLFGINENVVRIPSIIFSIISTVFIYNTSKLISDNNEKSSLLASLLFTLSLFISTLQIETRAYSLMIMLVTMNSYSFLRNIQTKSTNYWQSVWILSTVFGWYTHFFTIWIFIVQVIYTLFKFKSLPIKKLLIGVTLIILLFSPYLSILLQRFSDTENHGTWVEAARFDSIYFVLWKFCNNPLSTILFFIVFCCFTYFSLKQKHKNQQFITIWFWLPFLLMFLISLPHKFSIPMFIERYVSFVAPAFFIGIALFVVQIADELKKKSKYLVYVPLLFVFVMCLGLKNNTHTNIFKEYSEINRDSMPKKTVIQPYYGAFSYLYYNNIPNFKDFASSKIYDHMERQMAANDIYTSRKNSLNLFVSDTSHSIVCIEGELNRKNEIFVIDSFLNSKRYFASQKIIRSGNNYKIEVKTKQKKADLPPFSSQDLN
jgi:hypothetical protein